MFSRVKLRVSLALFCALSILLIPNSSYACAIGPGPDSSALEFSDVVFAGKLVGCFLDGNVSYEKYSVERLWKGETREFYTRIVRPRCRLDLIRPQIGKDVLIFAANAKDSDHIEFSFGPCSSSRGIGTSKTQYFLGFPLTKFFNVQGPPKALEGLGSPIYIFNK